MSLSSNMGKKLRQALDTSQKKNTVEELQVLKPLFKLQNELSRVPKENELLIEHIETKDGFHLFVYPFEGRLVPQDPNDKPASGTLARMPSATSAPRTKTKARA